MTEDEKRAIVQARYAQLQQLRYGAQIDLDVNTVNPMATAADLDILRKQIDAFAAAIVMLEEQYGCGGDLSKVRTSPVNPAKITPPIGKVS